jgi:serine/threonine protein kinase
MFCPSFDALRSFLAGRLDPEDHKLVEDHLNACDSCDALLLRYIHCDINSVYERLNSIESLDTSDVRYDVICELGQGSSGVVYLARDANSRRLVAMKAAKDGSREARLRIYKESSILESLGSHSGIISYIRSCRLGGRDSIILEYIDGLNLSELFDECNGKPFYYLVATYFVAQMAKTLAYIHSHGIVHMDLKLENAIVDRTLRPRIVDFSLATRLDGPLATIGGTELYMAPELWQGKVGTASDVYSLCIIFYVLLTGRFPFDESEINDMKRGAFNGDDVIISALGSCFQRSAFEEIPRILAMCLNRDPAQRMTAGVLADRLEKIVVAAVSEYLTKNEYPSLPTTVIENKILFDPIVTRVVYEHLQALGTRPLPPQRFKRRKRRKRRKMESPYGVCCRE